MKNGSAGMPMPRKSITGGFQNASGSCARSTALHHGPGRKRHARRRARSSLSPGIRRRTRCGSGRSHAPPGKLAIRHDDSGFFAMEFASLGELAAQKSDVAPGARAAVGPQQSHAKKEYEQDKNLRILDRGSP